MSLAASTNQRTDAPDLASIQRDNEVKRELRNARRRASYRKKEECTINLQNDVQDVPRPALDDITNVFRPSHNMPDKPTISLMQNDGSFPAPSNLTLIYPTNVPQSSNARMQRAHEEEMKLVNARRGASYRKQKEKGAINLKDDVQIVPRSPLGDMSNVDRNSYAMSGDVLNKNPTRQKRVKQPNMSVTQEKKEQLNAQRSAAYRKKKVNGTVEEQDENLPPLTISANPTSSSTTPFSHGDAILPPSSTITSGVIHDNVLARRQRQNERNRKLTDEQRE